MLHAPVLLNEVIEILNPKPGEFIIDGTFGSGGHTAAIIEKMMLLKGNLLATDWDSQNLENYGEEIEEKLAEKKSKLNFFRFHGNYANLPEILEKLKETNPKIPLKADGLLIDLGFSSVQLELNRGFSFQNDEPLDMRYDIEEVEGEKGIGNSGDRIPTAAEVINSYAEKELADIFYIYGEERFSRQIAKKIVEERRKERILTTSRLVEVVKMAVSKNYEKGRINPATRVFQALRIYVNKELDNLTKVLDILPKILKPKGKALIISFHSLEDRIVKNKFRDMEKNKMGKILTKKPVVASEEEIRDNPRSRSAKLRAIRLN